MFVDLATELRRIADSLDSIGELASKGIEAPPNVQHRLRKVSNAARYNAGSARALASLVDEESAANRRAEQA